MKLPTQTLLQKRGNDKEKQRESERSMHTRGFGEKVSKDNPRRQRKSTQQPWQGRNPIDSLQLKNNRKILKGE